MDRSFPSSRGLPNNPAQGVVGRGPRPPRLQSAVRDGPRSSPESSATAASSSSSATAVVAAAAAAAAGTAAPAAGSMQPGKTTMASTPISPGRVIRLMQEAMEKAVADEKTRANEAEASAIQGDTLTQRLGVTIDLSRESIPILPDEVIDIIKDRLERLALNHNLISAFPARFSECTPLRHLAARNNSLDAFPLPLCELRLLEYLDLGLNNIKVIPPEISKLTCLKALAVHENKIENLPACLGDMVSLVRLNVDGNPIEFPANILQIPDGTQGIDAMELKTTKIKKFLKQATSSSSLPEPTVSPTDRSEADTTEDDQSEEVETPRIPTKSRRLSSRFPVKVKGTSVPDLRSPSQRPPPVPKKAHARGLSQYGTSVRKPGLLPFTLGQATGRTQNAAAAQKPLPQAPVDGRARRPLISSPDEPSLQRPMYARQLTSLPMRGGRPRAPEPVSEVAKGILYSIFQVHLPIQTLMGLTNDGTAKRSSLEMVFYNTNVYLQELDQAIQENPGAQNRRAIQRAYVTLINAYLHVCSRLATNVDILVDNGDRRYLRTFLMSLYHCIMELRVVVSKHLLPVEPPSVQAVAPEQPPPLPLANPAAELLALSPPARYQPSNPLKRELQFDNQRYYPYPNGGGQAERTPRSAASFSSSVLSAGDDEILDASDFFERFFVSIQQTVDLVLTILPSLNARFRADLREARADPNHTTPIQGWEQLVSKCANAIQQGEMLRSTLNNLMAGDPAVENTMSQFWNLCNAFFNAWADFGNHLAQSIDLEFVRAQLDIKEGIRQIARSMKDSVHLMVVCRQSVLASPKSAGVTQKRSYGTIPSDTLRQVPVTPQSAALGPAVQATIKLM